MPTISQLAQTKTIVILFVLTCLLTAVFQLIVFHFDLAPLDDIIPQDAARQAIQGMSATQISAHSWLTGVVDVFYPLVYSSFFAGLIYRLFPVNGKSLALLPLAIIPIDLLEGLIQLLALNQLADLLAIKTYVTGFKFLLLGLSVVLVGWGIFKIIMNKIKA